MTIGTQTYVPDRRPRWSCIRHVGRLEPFHRTGNLPLSRSVPSGRVPSATRRASVRDAYGILADRGRAGERRLLTVRLCDRDRTDARAGFRPTDATSVCSACGCARGDRDRVKCRRLGGRAEYPHPAHGQHTRRAGAGFWRLDPTASQTATVRRLSGQPSLKSSTSSTGSRRAGTTAPRWCPRREAAQAAHSTQSKPRARGPRNGRRGPAHRVRQHRDVRGAC